MFCFETAKLVSQVETSLFYIPTTFSTLSPTLSMVSLFYRSRISLVGQQWEEPLRTSLLKKEWYYRIALRTQGGGALSASAFHSKSVTGDSMQNCFLAVKLNTHPSQRLRWKLAQVLIKRHVMVKCVLPAYKGTFYPNCEHSSYSLPRTLNYQPCLTMTEYNGLHMVGKFFFPTQTWMVCSMSACDFIFKCLWAASFLDLGVCVLFQWNGSRTFGGSEKQPRNNLHKISIQSFYFTIPMPWKSPG